MKIGVKLFVAALLLLLFSGLSLLLGASDVGIVESFYALFSAGSDARVIIYELRFPRTLVAVLAGAGLSLSGLELQVLFRNPLAGPFVLGISAGAGLGVGLVLLDASSGQFFALDGAGTHLAAMAGAGVMTLALLLASLRIRSSAGLLVLGLMGGYMASALLGILIWYSSPGSTRSYLIWTLGSFSRADWGDVGTLSIWVFLGFLPALYYMKSLNAIALGDVTAKSLGIHVGRVRSLVILSNALLAGAITAVCGPVSFIGIAVPHLCRMFLKTSDHRVLIPAVILVGGIIALIADIFARGSFTGRSLPLNAITALIGAPVVAAVLLSGRRGRLPE